MHIYTIGVFNAGQCVEPIEVYKVEQSVAIDCFFEWCLGELEKRVDSSPLPEGYYLAWDRTQIFKVPVIY